MTSSQPLVSKFSKTFTFQSFHAPPKSTEFKVISYRSIPRPSKNKLEVSAKRSSIIDKRATFFSNIFIQVIGFCFPSNLTTTISLVREENKRYCCCVWVGLVMERTGILEWSGREKWSEILYFHLHQYRSRVKSQQSWPIWLSYSLTVGLLASSGWRLTFCMLAGKP